MKLSDVMNNTPVGAPAETSTITGDKWAIALPRTRICTLEELVEHCKIDLEIWEVERFICNKWDQAAIPRATGKSKDWGRESTNPIITELFQVKAFLRKRKEIVAARKEIEALKKLAKQEAAVPVEIPREAQLFGNMLEINIPDAHFGKLAWGEETGGANYDIKIAQKCFVDAFNALVSRTQTYKFDEVLFIIGNDLLNSDDIENQTTAGTKVSTDGRYQKTFTMVRTTMIQCIEKLRRIAPVRVMLVPGNHDRLSVWHLGDSLQCYFNKYTDVNIDNTPRYRKYYRFGQVMLMFCHGEKGKRDDYPLLMATEESAMFGSTKFREAHTGHTHKTKLDEQHGVRVRVLPALCAADDWLAENGFVGNLRNAEAYVWNKDEGLIGMAFYSVREEK